MADGVHDGAGVRQIAPRTGFEQHSDQRRSLAPERTSQRESKEYIPCKLGAQVSSSLPAAFPRSQIVNGVIVEGANGSWRVATSRDLEQGTRLSCTTLLSSESGTVEGRYVPKFDGGEMCGNTLLSRVPRSMVGDLRIAKGDSLQVVPFALRSRDGQQQLAGWLSVPCVANEETSFLQLSAPTGTPLSVAFRYEETTKAWTKIAPAEQESALRDHLTRESRRAPNDRTESCLEQILFAPEVKAVRNDLGNAQVMEERGAPVSPFQKSMGTESAPGVVKKVGMFRRAST